MRVTAEKLQDRLSYPPRAMRLERACAYLGNMAPSTFLELVKAGQLPKPVQVRSMVMWDRFDLDSAFDELKKQSQHKRRNPFEQKFGAYDDETET